MKKIIFVLLFLSIFLISCKSEEPVTSEGEPDPVVTPPEEPPVHECKDFKEVIVGEVLCDEEYEVQIVCTECGKVKETKIEYKDHNFTVVVKEPTCTSDGYERTYCLECGHIDREKRLFRLGHDCEYRITTSATSSSLGKKEYYCKRCGEVFKTVNYIANGFNDHGKLSVSGRDLVDKDGNSFKLIGLSTHGLQWFGKYVNFDTIDAIHNEFYNNVFRLSLYTTEGGYCECDARKKEDLYNKVADGIRYALKCDSYVIVDWHMLGAEDENDRNPLYYLDEAKEFFGRISSEFKDYDNVLYEIMNEPSGTTTWEDCKKYANEIIPIIRENTDAIILVGNPKWSADLVSVRNDPLVGYTNIMYTFHFYANDSFDQTRLTDAYDNGIPVFVTEHGGMEATGDGPMDYTSLEKWYKEMDKRNISYVAWNISNSKGSASIIKYNDSTMKDFSDEHLKEWGIYYKNHIREEMGVNNLLGN